MSRWRAVLAATLAEHRPELLSYVAVYTDDPPEAAELVDRALISVLARRPIRTPAETAGQVEVEVRRSVAGVLRSKKRRPARPASAPDSQVDPPRLVAAVQRRRVGRLLRTCALGALVAGLGAAAIFGLGRLQAAESGHPLAIPPDSDDAEPTAPQILGPLTDNPALPDAQPLATGMLEAAGPGWSIVQYGHETVGGTPFYLVSPQGDRFEIPTPLAAEGWQSYLVDWLPATRLVLLHDRLAHQVDVVDILTGDRYLTVHDFLQSEPDGDFNARFVGDGTADLIVGWDSLAVRLTLGGEESARTAMVGRYLADPGDPRPWALSPDRTMVAFSGEDRFRVVSALDFSEVLESELLYPSFSSACEVQQWWDQQLLQVRCTSVHGGLQDAWLVPIGGGPPELLYTTDSAVMAWPVANSAVVLDFYGESDHVVAIDPEGGTRELGLEVPFAVSAVAGGRIFALEPYYCGPYATHSLFSFDPQSGDSITVFPAEASNDVIRSVVTHSDPGLFLPTWEAGTGEFGC